MPDTNKKPSTADLISHLSQNNMISNQQEVETYLTGENNQTKTPLSVHILSGIGAFLTSLFFCGTLAIANILNFKNPLTLVICGALALGLSYILSLPSKDNRNQNIFLTQLKLATLAAGKILLIMATILKFNTHDMLITWFATLAMGSLTLLTYKAYNSTLDRFISPLATLMFLYSALLFSGPKIMHSSVALSIIFCATLAVALYILLADHIKSFWQPLGLACLIFTCIILIMQTHPFQYVFYNKFIHLNGLGNIAMAIALLTTGYIASKNNKARRTDHIILAIMGIVALLAVGATSILAGLLILIIGYHNMNKQLLALGTISLSYFIVSYYYSLHLTLMHKSGILIASGIILLSGWIYINYVTPQKGTAK